MSQEQALAQYKRYIAENPDDQDGARKSYYDTFGVDPDSRIGAQAGAVSKQARKNLAKVQGEQTDAQTEQDIRDLKSQYVREIVTPVAMVGATLATGGLAAVPAALGAAGLAASGETAAQLTSPSDSVARDITMAGGLGGLSEFGGRYIGSAIMKRMAAKAATKAAQPGYAAVAEKLGFPIRNVEGRPGGALQARVDAMRRTSIAAEADQIMEPFGSPLTAEMAGQKAGGVFRSIESHFVQHAKDMRKFIKEQVGDVAAPLRDTVFQANKVKQELGKRVFRGKEDVEEFLGALIDENGATKQFSLDELLALKTDIGREAARLPESNPKRVFLDRLYGAVSEDSKAAIASKDQALANLFGMANNDFSTYFKALKNEVASRVWNAAKEGNGTDVVREFFKGDPSDISHVFQFVQDTRPQEMGAFRKTIQQAALRNIFGVADDGSTAIGYKLAERLDKLGADKLNTIFGGSQESMATLGRVKELAQLTSHFERSLKIPPDLSRQMDAGIKRLVMQAGVALGAKAWGAPYAAARIGAGVLKDAGDLVMAELAVRPELFRGFKAGYQKMATAVSTTSMRPEVRARLTSGGEREIKRALAGAANLAVFKMHTQPKREKKEADTQARAQSMFQGSLPPQ